MAIPPPIPGVQFIPNPMPAPKAQPRQNGMTPDFRRMTRSDKVIKANFDNVKGFQRAVKVFIMSYPEIMDSILLTHSRKMLEYINEMAPLYNVGKPDLSFMNQMYKDIEKEVYNIVITCKRVVGRDKLSNANLVTNFRNRQFKQRSTQNIDSSKEEQPFAPVVISLIFRQFMKLKSDANRRIILTIKSDTSVPPQQEAWIPFDLIIANTHPEGFEDWVDFGNGVRLLLNVTYKVRDEPNISSNFMSAKQRDEEVSTFHVKTIELMLRNRLYANQTRDKWTHSDHQQTAIKHKISYRRRYVDPNTDNYFWTKPDFGRTPQWIGPSDTHIKPRKSQTVVKFTDIQIGFKTNENFEDSVCLCNEWCNWNAFYYYNPIYRFLIVRHHQLYLKNMTNIPDMYLCITVLTSCGVMKTPVFQLMSCANDYRKRFRDNFWLKSPISAAFKHEYRTCEPNPAKLNALTYNKMRNELDVTKLCHSSDNNPFSDICVENLIQYYNVLIDLHTRLASNNTFVSNKYNWGKELDALGRNKYMEYMKQSYDKCLTQVLIGYDYLFTVDYEYASKLSQTVATQKIRDIRDHIMSKFMADSPFNLRVTLNPFLNTFASIYKFLAKVDPVLPVAHDHEALEILTDCYKQMDTDFDDYSNRNMTFDFQIDSTTNAFNVLQQNFEVFYTLKLYFYVFEIQKHCIDSVIQYNECFYYKRTELSKNFNFIWKHSMIEQKYRNSYPGEVLFDSPDFSAVFTEFYRNFWGRAQHEGTGVVLSLIPIDSAYFEYQRLYFWLRNGGNSKQKFLNIINSFIGFVMDITNRSEEIYDNQIMAGLRGLPSNYPYIIEVFDHLVYYLVKANCSVLLNAVAMFFKPMHGLQFSHLVQHDISFSLCKPGWVPLFRTMNTVLSSLEDMRNNLIFFDDEFNRISETCLQTKRMIKSIYGQFYAKLAFEWWEELNACFQLGRSSHKLADLTVLHLSVGLSFIAVFWEIFRYEFARMRKKLLKGFRVRFSNQLRHHVAFRQCLNPVTTYLQERQVIAAANPFLLEPWRSHLNPILTQFNTNTGQQLRIDLNAANI